MQDLATPAKMEGLKITTPIQIMSTDAKRQLHFSFLIRTHSLKVMTTLLLLLSPPCMTGLKFGIDLTHASAEDAVEGTVEGSLLTEPPKMGACKVNVSHGHQMESIEGFLGELRFHYKYSDNRSTVMGSRYLDLQVSVSYNESDQRFYDEVFYVNEQTYRMDEQNVTTVQSSVRTFQLSHKEGTPPLSFWGLTHLSADVPLLERNSTNSEALFGILLANRTRLLVADATESVIRGINLDTNANDSVVDSVLVKLEKRELGPYRLSKHPTQPYVYLAWADGIVVARLDHPASSLPSLSSSLGFEMLAGPRPPRQYFFGTGFIDNADWSEVRFDWPMITSRSISRNGSYLYIADSGNNAIRRVNTMTGATETIAGAPALVKRAGNSTSFPMFFDRPYSLALTQDGCNLFVAELQGGLIRWLKFDQPDGKVIEGQTVVTCVNEDESEAPVRCVTLSEDDNFMYIGVYDIIYGYHVNTSLLHKCTGGMPSQLADGTPPPPSGGTSGQLNFGLYMVSLAVGMYLAVLV